MRVPCNLTSRRTGIRPLMKKGHSGGVLDSWEVRGTRLDPFATPGC